MTQYRKKPEVVEAYLFTEPRKLPLPDWLSDAFMNGVVWSQGGDEPYLKIQTIEGYDRANIGDWIIRRVKGELYSCKPEIFALAYELVESPATG